MKIKFITAAAVFLVLVFAGCKKGGIFVIPDRFADGLIEADDAKIQYYGRWDFSDRKSPRADWGPVYVKARFEGTSCKIVMADEQINLGDIGTGNYYQYSIDKGPFVKLKSTKENIYTLAEGLADTRHEVIFVRRTESKWGKTAFGGFILDNGKKLADAGPRPKRKIEIVGDSISAGLANENTGWFTNETEDGYMAWGPQLARMLDAEWHVEARGAAYLMKPGGDYENYCMQKFFPQTMQSEDKILWNFNSWKPDVFMLALGTNDFSEGRATNKEEFTRQYREFVLMIREKYPDAHIFCVGPWKEGVPWDYCRAWITETVKNMRDKKIHSVDPVGDGKDLWIKIPGDYVVNDPYHPNIAGNTKIAERLRDIIEKKCGL